MARTTLTKQVAAGPNQTALTTLTWDVADTVNGNQFRPSGNDLILAWNTGASGHTTTLTSAPDERGRLGTITADAIAAGAIEMFGPVGLNAWRQSDGYIYIDGNHAEVKFAIIQLP